MSKYSFKDFKYVLNNIRDARYNYKQCDFLHYINCNFTADDDPMTIDVIMTKMRANPILPLLEKDDYRWEGSTIVFKDKNHAAIFYIYLE